MLGSKMEGKKMNWIERHINWTFALVYWFATVPLMFICRVTITDGGSAFIFMMALGLLTCSWAIRKKKRSLGWLALCALFAMTPLFLKNKRESS